MRDPSPSRPGLLLIEDDAGLRRSFQLLLQGQGFAVRAYASATTALADVRSHDAAVLVVDYRLPDNDGFEVLRTLRARGWQGRAVMITGFPSDALATRAAGAGFAAFLEKPVQPHRLITALNGGS